MSSWSGRSMTQAAKLADVIGSRRGRWQGMQRAGWNRRLTVAVIVFTYSILVAVLLFSITVNTHLIVKTNFIYDTRFSNYRHLYALQTSDKHQRLDADAKALKAVATATMRSSVNAKSKASLFPAFTIANKKACAGVNVDVVICVHTHPSHAKTREIIRHTWGSEKHWQRHSVRTLFFTGRTSNDSSTQKALEMESDVFGDIVQGAFEDTYRNLTLKALAVLRWVHSYCSHAVHFVKIDDDVILNVFSVQELFAVSGTAGTSNNRVRSKVAVAAGANSTAVRPLKDNEIACIAFKNVTVKRQGKWRVTETELSASYVTYPQFCAGMGYFMRTRTALALHDVVGEVPFLWIDDIYVTGFLAEKVKATFLPFNERIVWSDKDILYFVGKRWYVYYMAHIKNKKFMRIAFSKLVTIANQMSISSR